MKKSELINTIREEFLTLVKEDRGYIGDKKLSDLLKMGTADMNLWHVVKLIDAGIISPEDKKKALKALDPRRPLEEDRKAKEYVMSIEDEEEREEERKRMFGSDEGEIEEATYEVSPEDVDKIKNKVGDEDVVKVAEE